jgi:hypothetical protein
MLVPVADVFFRLLLSFLDTLDQRLNDSNLTNDEFWECYRCFGIAQADVIGMASRF